MDREELEAVRKNNAEVVRQICAQYGLYGNVVYYEPSPISGSSLNRMYMVAGTSPVFGNYPLPKRFRPNEVLQAINRNEKLFYPQAYVLDLLENKDEITATQSLVEYCKKAEFINQLYHEYGLKTPNVLRYSEVYQLIRFRDGLDNPLATPAMKKKYKQDLDWFFRREKSKSKFRQSWLRYFRSEKFPDDKGPVAKLKGFIQRNQCKISLNQLMDTNTDVHKLELQEYEYKIFQKLIQERYPFVTYAAGDMNIVNHGLREASQRDDSPFGKMVTAEEYAVVRKDRFADEGWDSVANLKPAYWEFRNVYYKASDEPLIASVYQHIALQYAKCDSLGELKQRGPMRLQKVPMDDFMNFVSLAKANKLRFYIDTLGDYETPSLNTVNVLYNEHQQQKMDVVLGRMIEDTVSYSHVISNPSKPPLKSVIDEIEGQKQPELPNRQHPPRKSSYEK